MTVKIAFLDPAGGDYTPDTPRLHPLGGSQSALCYLAEALAAAGLEVTLVNGTRTPGMVRGVRCLPAGAVPWEGMRAFDVVVLLNGCPTEALTRLRATLDGGRKLILWMQHAADQPAAQCVAEPQARACWDALAFVSRWQMDGYLKEFDLDRRLCRILRNGIAPAFSGLFPAGADIMAGKPWPPVLAYTSTPFRGLDVLLDSVPRLRAAIPGTTVRVFSSLEGYQVPADQDPYAALYQRCRDTEGVDYVGAVSQGALAEALRGATGFAYPNRFTETSCIAVMEALAAGCLVVSSALGALPETTAGFARLIPVPEDPAEHAVRFADAAGAALVQWRDDRAAAGRRLREQVDHVTAGMNWAGRAGDWLAWLDELRGDHRKGAAPGKAVAAVTADLAEAQQRLLDALGGHLNARPQDGDDHAWRAEARALIALIERSLRLDHNTEENRSAVWTTLRGFDAWFAYVTTLSDAPPPAAPPAGGRRIYDCFQFYNELDLLEVRLAELDAVVDRFVLVEATFTHAGDPKPLHYAENRARFAAYADKIIHVVVDDDPGGFAWQREAHQRDAITRGLDGCDPTDMIVVSDADEILRPWVMERLRREPDDGRSLFAPHLDIFLYFLDLKSPDPWVSVAAAPWELIRRIGANRARYLTKLGHGRVVPDAGWHFTWMGGIERFRAKLRAFAHREMIAAFERDPAANRERLDRFYATGRFDGGAVPGMWTSPAPVPIDASFPRPIRERIDHFRALGWISPDASPPVSEEPAEEAGAEHRRALVLDPASIDAFHVLAMERLGRNAPEAAVGPLRRCAVLDPFGTFHRFHLAHALLTRQRYGEAAGVLRELIRLAPDDHRARANLGIALKNLGRHDEAVDIGRLALALAPAEPGVLSNLGLALSLRTGGDEAAARVLRRAVAIDPDFTSARLNLGLVLSKLRRIGEAEAQCRRVLDRDPNHAEAHTLLGTCLLLRGELEAGFREYEWRTRLVDRQVTPRGLPTPVWEGGNPDGLTILLHDEQGLGDGIQFVRYAPLLRRRGARVIVECNDRLVRLFATLSGVDAVVGRSDSPPPHDAHAALLSLPHRLGTTLATVPAEIPYLRAEPALAAAWATRLGPPPNPRTGLRVGLVWAGNPEFKDDRRRSPGLDALRSLLDVPGVAVFGLQKGAGRRDLDRCGPLPPSFTDLGAEIADFADTAAIMQNLDLVISSCTAPAHLAGALGRPVWTLLPDIADWRWLERGDTTPWYPTMRLFRQAAPGDWASVVADVRAALARAVATGMATAGAR
ncbi:tetratricopeptide repeat protein [Azospirillum sp. YIM DDC1]|uniref:Tetratricopeptide repeat protein n=1 Tax=Azospirillum aestuarii TaxID=2802052 RepID=A0ABS1I1X3_9PROT|nr:tetratricopeptide repeat protein [Azospirillum aestuarii]MBK4720926.1 tetratricopeptide repeat protein [Azospirillum aestuarii]